MLRTKSESLFEDYLQQKGLKFERDFFYEPYLGHQKRPDYLVKSTVNALFEIKEFSVDSKFDKRLMSSTHIRAIGLPLYAQSREKLRNAQKKFRPFKKRFPCVLVLHKGTSITAELSTEILAGSAFGDISITFSSAGTDHQTIFGRNGWLSPNKNTTFSAISVIEELHPDKQRASTDFWKAHSKETLKNKSLPQIADMFELWSAANGYDLSKRFIRMRVVINPFATMPIPSDFFNTQFDEVYGFEEAGRLTKLNQ